MMNEHPTQAQITFAIVFYCICSGSMLIVNKLAVMHLPLPALVTVCQFASASSFVYSCKLIGLLEMDDFDWHKAKYFAVYVLAFAIGTWTNMKVLATSNVETVIVFRSCCPIVVAGFDYIFYRRACPTIRSWLSLLLVTFGAVGYIVTDKEFQSQGWVAYYWVAIWWAVLLFQLTYGKFLVSGLPLRSLWTPVLYTNTFSIVPALVLGVAAGELSEARLQTIHLTNAALFWLLASCVIGIGISWAGFLCQSMVSATSYTVVGVMNKMLTVTVNVLIWDKHASGRGIASLAVCLLGGSLYQQAPLREPSTAAEEHYLKKQVPHEESEEELGDDEIRGSPSLKR